VTAIACSAYISEKMAAPYEIICYDFLNAVMMYVMCQGTKLNFKSPLIELKKREEERPTYIYRLWTFTIKRSKIKGRMAMVWALTFITICLQHPRYRTLLY
jgi:hypothetical protein